MSILTDQTNAAIKAQVKVMLGTIATTPALLVTDGINTTYACDVNIGNFDSTGTINQYKRNLLGIPGTDGYQVDDSLIYGTVLRNVPLARNNASLIYADIGTPVTISRNESGQWVVNGFAEEQVGTYTMVPVDLSSGLLGPIQNLTSIIRPLEFGELALYGGGFGTIPFGAMGIFVNGILQSIRI
jgi:hypothetical protein